MPDPTPVLTDCTVTLAGEELVFNAIEFDTGEVVLRRDDWDEDALQAMRAPFLDGDVQTLTITLPDRRFEYPVQTPSVRRFLDSDGPAVEMTFTVPGGGYSKYTIPRKADP